MNPRLVFYIIQLLEGMGMGSFYPIYTPWLGLHGLNYFKMGVVNFVYHISTSILDPFTGYLADKFGKRKIFIIGQIFWTSTQYIYGASSQIFGFLTAEAVAAIGQSLKSDALESWLQNEIGEIESSKVMGKSKSLFTLGQITTGILAGFISERYGMQIAWYASGTFFLIATVLGSVALHFTKENLPADGKLSRSVMLLDFKNTVILLKTNKILRNISVFAAVYSFANKPLFMYWPQIVESLGMKTQFRGLTILAVSLPILIGSLMAGHNIFFTRNKGGISKILLLSGIGLMLSGFAQNLTMFYIGFVLIELVYGTVAITIYGHTYSEIDSKYRSTLNSTISSIKTLGGAISLLIMGQISDLSSPQIALLIAGISLLTMFALYIKSQN